MSADGHAIARGPLAILLAAALACSSAPRAGAQEPPRRYPPGRAAELKARLLDRPSAPEAAAWALEYVEQPEVERLEPVPRAAEKVWAARLGLAAGSKGGSTKKLRSLLASLESCPLDSLAIRRAGCGIARVGVVVPLSGRFDRYGKTFVQGLRLPFEAHNREWAPNISLILHDSEGDPLIGARKARWLLRDHGVSVLVGELFSANTAPLAAASQVVGAVLISPSATNERLATLGDAVFQLHVGDGVMAQALAGLLAHEGGDGVRPLEDTLRRSVAILASRTPGDSARALAVESACKRAGIGIMGKVTVDESAVDLTRPLSELSRTRAYALVLLAPPKLAGIAAAQLPGLWPKVRVIGFDTLDPEGLNAEARAALEGATYFTPDYAITGAPRDSFEARYQRAYGEPPTRMSARGYLVGLALTRAIERGSLNASMLREALRAQLYETEEGRVFRALKPLVPAEPEQFVIRSGKAVPAQRPLSP